VVRGLCTWLGIDAAAVDTLDLQPQNRTQHPRSIRAARLAYSVKRFVDRRQLLPGSVRDRVRRAYQRANAGSPPEGMSSDVRGHVEELYRESNELTARALTAHGYDALPPWLRTYSTAD